MSPVLEATIPNFASTCSFQAEDLFSGLDVRKIYVDKKEFILPEIGGFRVEAENWIWPLSETQTARFYETQYIQSDYLLEEDMSSSLPPKRKFSIKLRITSIKKGSFPRRGDEEF